MSEVGQPQTPPRLNVSQAAKAVRKARSTINRDIANGKVSITRDGKGQPFLEIAELERVYGRVTIDTLSDKVSEDGAIGHDRTPQNGNSDSALDAEVQILRERLSALAMEREREREQLTEQIEDLRRRLDRADEERREKDRQLTALLTDQRPETEAPAPNAGRGFWARLRGRA